MNLTPVAKFLKELDESDLLDFKPDEKMEAAKERFWSTIKNNPLLTNDIGNMTLDALIMHSRTKKITAWMEKHPMFLAWFCDEHFEQRTVQRLVRKAFKKVEEILDSPLEPKVLTAKDQLNAANLMFQLGDKFPNKRREFVYVDKELAKMTEADVDKEMKLIENQLSGKQALPASEVDKGE